MTASTATAYDPATPEPVGDAPRHTAADVSSAITAGKRAGYDWSTSRAARQSALQQIANLIRNDAERLGELLSREQGKVLPEAIGEFNTAADLFDYYAELDWAETESLPPRSGR